ncbi:MAG: hypothetical protein U5J63_00740 [Fodinibius sp.]|nr:hypothetical protein [Fodinibius sp.]
MNSTFRNLCIALLVAVALSGCRWGCSPDKRSQTQQNAYQQPDPLAMVVKHRFDTSSNRINAQVTQTLDYASIPYSTYDLTLGASILEIPNQLS